MIEAIFAGIFAVLGLVVFPRLFLKVFRDAREAMSTVAQYRAPTAEEAPLVARLDAQKAKHADLVALGFDCFGDLVLVLEPGQRVHLVIRVFIDAPRKTCAYLAVVMGYVAIAFESYTDTQEFVTSHARGDSYIEAGPTSLRQFVHSRAGMARAYRKHVELAASATVTMTNLDEVKTAMTENHERMRRWRQTQPPDTLLDRDLRKLLGRWYRLYGRWIAKRVHDLPRATVRRG